MIDAHCHLHAGPKFPTNRKQILADFDKTLRSKMLHLSSEHTNTFCVIGTHPWQVHENPVDWIEIMDPDFIQKHAIIGVGEIGLDYFRAESVMEKKLQMDLFETQLQVAHTFKMPVVLHCVKAHQDLLAALLTFEHGGIIHGFRSSYEIAKRYLKEGFLISIGNAINSKNGVKLRDSVRNIGVDNIVIESDARLLEHASLDKTMQTLAEIFKLDIESLEMRIEQNLERVFPEVKK